MEVQCTELNWIEFVLHVEKLQYWKTLTIISVYTVTTTESNFMTKVSDTKLLFHHLEPIPELLTASEPEKLEDWKIKLSEFKQKLLKLSFKMRVPDTLKWLMDKSSENLLRMQASQSKAHA